MPAAIVWRVFPQAYDLVGLDVVVVGMDVDVLKINLVDSANLLLDGILLCEEGPVDGAGC